jgi:acetyltransferase
VSGNSKYPKRFEKVLRLNDGTEIFVRPLKPEDKDKLYQMYTALSKDTNYSRFLIRKPITRWIVEKWVEINYTDKMALIATVKEDGEEKIIADARFYTDKETGEAEIAAVVQDHWQNRGVGTKLLQYTVEVAREMGVKTLYAYVSPENKRIIHITKKLGFKAKWMSDSIEYKIDLPLK